jgi:hypothetical protein
MRLLDNKPARELVYNITKDEYYSKKDW